MSTQLLSIVREIAENALSLRYINIDFINSLNPTVFQKYPKTKHVSNIHWNVTLKRHNPNKLIVLDKTSQKVNYYTTEGYWGQDQLFLSSHLCICTMYTPQKPFGVVMLMDFRAEKMMAIHSFPGPDRSGCFFSSDESLLPDVIRAYDEHMTRPSLINVRYT